MAPDAVERLAAIGTHRIHVARMGAERLWELLHGQGYVQRLGALTGNQAVQQVQAGLKAIYVSGWQVAGDANLSGQMYPDQSLYPSNSVPPLVRAINNALAARRSGFPDGWRFGTHWLAPDGGGRRSGLWRYVERLRTHEGDD